MGTLSNLVCYSLCYSCLVSSCIVLISVFTHFSLSFVQVLICFMHTWISWNTAELGLPSQSDPLVRGSLNLRAICRLVVYLYTSLFCPVPRPVSPLTLCGSDFCFVSSRFVSFCLLLSSRMAEKG